MIFKSKIFRRFLTAYLPATLVPLIIIASIILWYGLIEIRKQTFIQLQIMADSAEAQVLDYLNYLKIRTSGYGASKPVLDALKRYFCQEVKSHSARSLNRHLASYLKEFPECVEMFVLDVNGRVMASSDASNTGKDLSETDYFLNGRKAVYVSDIFREEETGRITWLVSCPVMNNKVNRLLAVLVCRINPVTLSDITTERKIRALGAKSQALRIGETGETYMVNRGNLMITESRFLNDVILKQPVDTEIVRRTRKAGETKAGKYPDYRNILVNGFSMVIWETGWIIISETDYEESIMPFQRLLYLSLASIGVLIPLIFFASWLLSRRLTVPILRLVQADRAVIQGDPSRAFISDHEMPADEMGEVMHSRNKMLNNLKIKEEALREETDRLAAALKERDVLLKEIHHRVKNNLQVMISLLRLQVRVVKEEHSLGVLKDIHNRLAVMSLIHEKLYRSKDLARIGFRDYIKDLTEELLKVYGVSGGRISLKTDVVAIESSIGKAIPVGLIVNELITNSIKYAFPGNRTGEIRVTVQPISENRIELIVADNGIGIPGDLDIRNTKTLGMQIVTSLAEQQLRGRVEMNRDSGTEFRITFPS